VGRRSRKRRHEDAPATTARKRPPAGTPTSEPKPPSRTERKNAEARAALKPLEPGERPRAVTVGAIATVGLVVANVVVYAAGLSVRGDRPQAFGFVLFAVVMLTMAWGLWKARYWAVLALQALLAIIVLFFSLFLLRFQSVTDVLIALGVIVPASVLFYFLIKAMARIQMPERPTSR
jgi:hypothetical protein